MDDPSKMSDEELKAKIEETPQEEPKEEPKPEETPPKEEAAPEAPEEPQEEAPQVEPEEPEAPAEPISRRKAERLEKLENLVEKLRGPQPARQPEVKGLDYGTALEADPEVVKQLEADRQSATQSAFNQGLEQAKSIQFHTRLEIDAPRVESKYPILDKDSTEFNPALANSINQWYLGSVGYDPKTDRVANSNVRYSDFVEGIMEVAGQMAGEQNTQSVRNIAKQAANTALRPDGSTAKRLNLNKAPQQMSDEELKAVIAQAGI